MFEKQKITKSYTIEKCNKCNKEIQRPFKQGDYLFKESSKCSMCDGTLLVEKIFGEIIEQ